MLLIMKRPVINEVVMMIKWDVKIFYLLTEHGKNSDVLIINMPEVNLLLLFCLSVTQIVKKKIFYIASFVPG